MVPPSIGKMVIAERASRPDRRNPINSSRGVDVPKHSSRRGDVPKDSPQGANIQRPNAPPLLAGPSQILSALPWPPETPKQQQSSQRSHLPKPSIMNTLQAQHWKAPRAPIRILQRPTISRPTPQVAEGTDHAEAFVNPRPAPPVPGAQQNRLPQTSKTNLPRARSWQVPRAPVRILQRPTISRPTPQVAEGTDRVEAFVHPRPAPPVPGAVVKLPVASPLIPHVDAGARIHLPVVSPLLPQVDAGVRVDPRNRSHQDQVQVGKTGSDSGKTTISRIIRTADPMQLLAEAQDLPIVKETEETKRSGFRRKFAPASRLPRANKTALLVNTNGEKLRVEAFGRFKEQMDREKEEYDRALWREGGRERKRDQRILKWLEGIPREAEREFDEGLL